MLIINFGLYIIFLYKMKYVHSLIIQMTSPVDSNVLKCYMKQIIGRTFFTFAFWGL